MASWSSWLARHPVKVEVAGSSPVEVAGEKPESIRIRAFLCALGELGSRRRRALGCAPRGSHDVTGVTYIIFTHASPRGSTCTTNLIYTIAQQNHSVRTQKRSRTEPGGVRCGFTLFQDPPITACRTVMPLIRAADAIAGGVTQVCSASDFATLLRDTRKQCANLGLAVTTMPTERTDRRELAGLGPTSDRLRVNAEHGGNLSRRQQRFGIRGASGHERPPRENRTNTVLSFKFCTLDRDARNGASRPSR